MSTMDPWPMASVMKYTQKAYDKKFPCHIVIQMEIQIGSVFTVNFKNKIYS